MHNGNSDPFMWLTCAQLKKNGCGAKALPVRSQVSQTSKFSSSSDPLQRRPMLDISNKLHAMVDEFVSNLSSECDSLVNHASARVQKHVANDSRAEGPRASRPSNRTTMEVLTQLRRPSEFQVKDSPDKEGKSNMEMGSPIYLEGKKRLKDNGRSSRQPDKLVSKSASVEGMDDQEDTRSVEILFDTVFSKSDVKHGRGTQVTAPKGKLQHTVEILSSDHSSDDNIRPIIKPTKKLVGKHHSTKMQPSTSPAISAGKRISYPSTSPESSHVMNYSYEEDTHSQDSKNPPVSTTFLKLKLPEDVRDDPEDGETWKRNEHNAPDHHGESSRKHERKKPKEDLSTEEGDESSESDDERNPHGTETDVEELPVLPKVPVKRKLMNDSKGGERKTQRGRTKSSSPQVKKLRTPQIDASVITKLEFGRRPANSVSILSISL